MQFCSFKVLACGLLCASAMTFSQPLDPDAPTGGVKSAAEVDREWQDSVAKFNAQRARILAEVDRQAGDGPHRANWETLHIDIPQWYQNAKLGIFIHWGVFSVPASQNEWYPRNMYQQKDPAYAEHIKRFGPQDQFGYKDFIPRFKAEHWEPADWARLFKKAGARYVIPVAEHHDGFALYDSDLSDWTAAKMGPSAT